MVNFIIHHGKCKAKPQLDSITYLLNISTILLFCILFLIAIQFLLEWYCPIELSVMIRMFSKFDCPVYVIYRPHVATEFSKCSS